MKGEGDIHSSLIYHPAFWITLGECQFSYATEMEHRLECDPEQVKKFVWWIAFRVLLAEEESGSSKISRDRVCSSPLAP